ncbi:mitochondrial ribosomal protein L18 [Nomia melanderi]|uniref:mitochondrial ribosomal protein L18 n=1 Tax=Nomia melanderi TaxID=2448451 RepID=UPI0013040F79|nr:39S ribosomal protein L18, mitochondrial [Nomia melanderi]
MLFLRRLTGNILVKRQVHGNAEIIANCKEVRNRNPRNLERLRIARKPIGYALDKQGFSYWHKLVISSTQRYVTGEIHHFENGPVIRVSTKEWGLKKQLYSLNDSSAHINVGRVLAQRCLECGICEVFFDEENAVKSKDLLLVEELKKAGISLSEPYRYRHFTGAAKFRDEKPWESYE